MILETAQRVKPPRQHRTLIRIHMDESRINYSMEPENTFYVYKYLRPEADEYGPAGSPNYIGKGKGTRAFSKPNSKKHNSVPVPEDKKNISIVSTGMSEVDAFQAEVLGPVIKLATG